MRTGAVTLIATGLLVTGCAGAARDPLTTGEDFSVLSALSEVPAPDDASLLVVQVGDLKTAIELSGLERDGDLDESAWDWMGPLFPFLGRGEPEAPIYVPLPGVLSPESFRSLSAVDEELGWSLVDVDAFVAMNLPGANFSVVAGDFDEQTLAHLPDVADGVVTAGEGADNEPQSGSSTAARRLGRPLRMAQSEGRIAASFTLPAAQDWVEGAEGSLADDEELAAVAAALDDEGAITAYLTRGGDRSAETVFRSSPDFAVQAKARSSELMADPFDLVGIGWAAPDGEPEITVAYSFTSDKAAERAAEDVAALWTDGESLLVGEPLSRKFTLIDSESTGRVAVVHLRPANDTPPEEIVHMLETAEVVFLHQ